MRGVIDGEAELENAISRYVGSHETSPLLESIMVAAQTLDTEQSRRRVVLAISLKAESQLDVAAPSRVVRILRTAGASLWALDFGWTIARAGLSEERVLAEATTLSGGRRERLSSTRVLERVERTLDVIFSQYLLTYDMPPDASPDSALLVRVRRDQATVLAPTWVFPR